jgi:hypothetical protein
MLIGHIQNATRVLGAPKNWDQEKLPCGALPILDVETPAGPQMVSAWEPTPDEVAKIVAGAPVYLSVIGVAHPPVAVFVGEPPEESNG